MKSKILLLLICFTCLNLSIAQEFKPPYLGHSSNWVMTMFKVNTNNVRNFLPKGVEPKTDKNGMTNLGLEFYELDDLSGLPTPYFIAFIFVQIDSVQGKHFPSNFPIWGVFNDSTAATSYSKNYGFPYKHTKSTFSLTKKDLTWTAVLGKDQLINLELTQTLEKSKNVGTGDMISMKNNQLLHSQVAWINNGFVVNSTKLKITPKGDPVLKLIEHVTPYWSLVSQNQIFTYTKPVFLKINDK